MSVVDFRHVPFAIVEMSDDRYMTLPRLYEKYRLSIGLLWTLCMSLEEMRVSGEWPERREFRHIVDRAIRNHWFVCRYLEAHPEAATAFLQREPGWYYFDILDKAEELYGHSKEST